MVSYVICVLMVVGTLFENTTIDGLFAKNLPKEIRGSLNGAYNFFGNIGLALFSKFGGIFYDSVGPTSPFILVGICDVAFAIFVFILWKVKIFTHWIQISINYL